MANKLPMSLINDNKDKERKDGLVQHKAKIRIESEAFGDTFGPKAQRKRPRLAVSSIEDLAQGIDKDHARHRERQEEARYLAGQSYDDQSNLPLDSVHGADAGELTTAREPVFSKGQSKRIWNELYKVIDSSDVVIHVLDARDPLGTRCRSVEKYIREEAPHKHLLFLINKCDLIPTSVAVRSIFLFLRVSATIHHIQLQSPFLFEFSHAKCSSQGGLRLLRGQSFFPGDYLLQPWQNNLAFATLDPLPLWHDQPRRRWVSCF